METQKSGESLAKVLGAKLRGVRKQVGMTQEAVGSALGLKDSTRHVYVGKLERGELPGVSFRTVVRYLKACKVPIGKFMLELAQSGAFGEAEAEDVRGFTSQKLRGETPNEEARRARGRLSYERRWLREAQDADIIAKLWREVMPATLPLLPSDDPTRRLLAPYLEGVRALYRAWKQAVRGAANKEPTPDVRMAFDRIEQLGCQRLVPAAVRKIREIVFDRLMAMVPQGGKP
jgi:transcriptional regulator with XRE-family HTH domain